MSLDTTKQHLQLTGASDLFHLFSHADDRDGIGLVRLGPGP